MISKKNVIVIDLLGSTSYNSLVKLGYDVIDPYDNSSRKYYRIRQLLHRFKLEKCTWFDYYFKLNVKLSKKENSKVIIIIGSLIYEPFLKMLREIFPTIPISYSFSNIVKNSASISPYLLRKYNIIGWSWDKEDCKKYNLNYIRPAIDPNIFKSIDRRLDIYDLCFIGADKGRYKLVKEISHIATASGINSYTHITPDYSFLKFIHKDYKEPIPYDKYLEIVSSSKCIIDLVQKGQVGTTMRTLEAIFSNKKLISNNPNLIDYDFYHPNNIFILSESNIDEIPGFLRKPYVPIDKDILDNYVLDRVIEDLINTTFKLNDEHIN